MISFTIHPITDDLGQWLDGAGEGKLQVCRQCVTEANKVARQRTRVSREAEQQHFQAMR